MIKTASSIYEINGYGIVLPMVQNYYPVERNGAGGWEWGFKYSSGIFEYFQHSSKNSAIAERNLFMYNLDAWHRRST